MGWADGEINLVLYVDDGRIVGKDHELVQDALIVTVATSRSMGLGANLEKTKAMVCTPRFIWGKWGETVYKRQATGKGATFRDRKRMRVS